MLQQRALHSTTTKVKKFISSFLSPLLRLIDRSIIVDPTFSLTQEEAEGIEKAGQSGNGRLSSSSFILHWRATEEPGAPNRPGGKGKVSNKNEDEDRG
jgi:hypothetical protein